jgi:arginyl-tRNA synthetase
MVSDITLNCFRLAGPLKSNPMQLAIKAAEFLRTHEDVKKVEAIKAYVNITLTETALYRDTVEDLKGLMDSAHVAPYERKHILIEYSAPNTNKPLHLGHLRNNSLGMALVEILKRVGHEVTAVNLVNDRGIHICKSMIAYQRFGNNDTPDSTGKKGDHLVGDFYVAYDKELKRQVKALKDHNPELNAKSDEELFLKTKIGQATQKILQDWENGDPEVHKLWQTMNDWTLNGFNQTYARMKVCFDKVYFESDTYKLGRKIVAGGLRQGIFYKTSNGAVEIDLTADKLDRKVVMRNDGTSLYITQDLGTTKLKDDDFNPDAMIWVVGDEQIYHFRVLFAICKKLGYKWADNLFHLAYGMVNLPSGRMKSREGTVVDADQLFDEMHALAKKEILNRLTDLTPEELETRAEIIGVGAVKFMLLKVNPKNAMKFDPEAAVKFEGDTGALVQYAYARISSIKRKAAELEIDATADWSLLTHAKERELAIKCAQYPDILKKSARDYDCCCLAIYLLELARAFNSFYHDCPVIKGDVSPLIQRSRLELIDRVQRIIGDGLKVLTIDRLESM